MKLSPLAFLLIVASVPPHSFMSMAFLSPVSSFRTICAGDRPPSLSSSNSPTSLHAKPQSLGKSGDWEVFLDPTSNQKYYFNMKTGASEWTPPSGFKEEKSTKDATANGGFGLPNLFSSEVKKEVGKDAGTATSTTATATVTATIADNKPSKPTYTDGASSLFSSVLGPPSSKITPSSTPLTPLSSSINLPHPEKLSWGGEDALYLPSTSSLPLTFGVFDGVSGAEKANDLILYSRMLSNEFGKRVVGKGSLDLKNLSERLTEAAEVADEKATGATTALVASISTDNTLRVLSLGDCSLLLIRSSKPYAQTKDISHYFDCPYQLGDVSPDRPKDGTTMTVKLVEGDVLVCGSDGVFDNLRVSRICELGSDGGTPERIAKGIAEEARKISLIETNETPYSVLAGKNKVEGYENGLGGKVDDICCVVIKV